jgi:hypothetical protein
MSDFHPSSGHRSPPEPRQLCANSGSPILFDHLVGAGEQRGRHGKAERGGGLEIDGKSLVAGCSTFANLPQRRSPAHSSLTSNRQMFINII